VLTLDQPYRDRQAFKAMIVLTTDLSEESTRAFGPAVELAGKLGLEVVLLHVVEDLKVPPHGSPLAPAQSSPETADEVHEAKEKLERLRADLGAGVKAEVITGQNVARSIAKYAADHGAAFIALSTHGHSGLRHLVLGSVAEEVLHHAKTPVISYPKM